MDVFFLLKEMDSVIPQNRLVIGDYTSVFRINWRSIRVIILDFRRIRLKIYNSKG